ncbi:MULTISPECIES: hypothetical protein [unclassified Chelatococcus]|uniref:hypothetical protein n=1 Tax=unclassified Chelatococcus TaxID=2638111 RepID=UPI001BCCD6B7|nr:MULTISPECIES: hypothetical protein [unclassified Chelatococcus]MBS7699199.1 hypothetical protein [Chelatococcus sp. YT9]MBX3554980.1 hypothetical protein [Chelatococcus sp.]
MLWIQNVTPEGFARSDDQPHDYVLKINRNELARFQHIRAKGAAECLRAAADAFDKAEALSKRDGWVTMGAFADPPPAPEGMKLEVQLCPLLGSVSAYRHVPEPPPLAMPISRAIEIVGMICHRSFHAMGVTVRVGDLDGVSLAAMVEAKRLVEAENDKPAVDGARTIHVVPDDRLIAAAYALANYEPRHGAVVSEPDGDGLTKALAIVRITAEPQRESNHG